MSGAEPLPGGSPSRRAPLGRAGLIPSFLWIQQGFGLTAVFVVIAVIVVIAAVAVTQIGPEAKGLALDEIAPPTA